MVPTPRSPSPAAAPDAARCVPRSKALPNLPRGAVPLLLLLATLSLPAPPASAYADDYFPLQVGNWWEYKCTRVPWPTICSEGDPPQLLAVSDTLRLDLSARDTTRTLTTQQLPASPEGQRYFVLTGSLLNTLYDLSVQHHSECTAFPYRRPTSALLVYQNDHETSWRGYPAVPGVVWLAGVSVDENWLLLSEDLPLWDVSTPSLIKLVQLRIDRCTTWQVAFSNDLVDDFISVAAGRFYVPSTIQVDNPGPAGWNGQRVIYYSPGVGFVRINELDLAAAQVSSQHYPTETTVAAPTSWASVKGKDLRP